MHGVSFVKDFLPSLSFMDNILRHIATRLQTKLRQYVVGVCYRKLERPNFLNRRPYPLFQNVHLPKFSTMATLSDYNISFIFTQNHQNLDLSPIAEYYYYYEVILRRFN